MATEFTIDRGDVTLAGLAVLPEGEARGVVQITHGMAEHKERYLPFMERLAAEGYAAFIHDLRGHGASVKEERDLGWFGGEDGCASLINDQFAVTEYLRGRYPSEPLVLFGHSMGSLLVRAYVKRKPELLSGLIVCGCPGPNPAAGAGLALARAMRLVKGGRCRSKTMTDMVTGAFNKGFSTENEWLSVNPENVAKYNADPLCGFPFTLEGYIALFKLMQDVYSDEKQWSMENLGLPVRFISGAEDPCRPTDAAFEKAMACMRSVGYSVSGKLYAGLRHEILNETDNEEVLNDILAMLAEWTA